MRSEPKEDMDIMDIERSLGDEVCSRLLMVGIAIGPRVWRVCIVLSCVSKLGSLYVWRFVV